MNQKGLANILLIIIIVALAGAGLYFAATRQTIPPTPIPTPTPSPSPTPTPTPTPSPKPTPTPTPKPSPALTPLSTCNGISNTLTAELDGQPIESLKLVTGGQDPLETINGGYSFDSMFVANADNNRIEKDIFLGALRLSPGRQVPQKDARANYQLEKASFHIEYREYDRNTLPYTYRVGFIPQTINGWIETRAIAAEPNEHVCGSFDITGTGNYGIGSGSHTIHIVGSFNQVLPPPRPGSSR